MDRAWLDLGPKLMILGLMSAGGPHFLALAVPGNQSVGPYDPVGAPYGRRGHGRLRRPCIQISVDGKGLKGLGLGLRKTKAPIAPTLADAWSRTH